jgi:hypothetical protein
MTSTRRFLISALGAVLVAAPLITAQDLTPPPAGVILTQPILTPPIVTLPILTRPILTRVLLTPPLVMQDLPPQPQPFLAFSSQSDPAMTPVPNTRNLSRYRDFQFGMDLFAVAKQAEVKPSEARVIHERPAIIQGLQWRTPRALVSSSEADPVKGILFSFYNGELFRMVVTYDQFRTEGLTNDDLVEAISAEYGTATKPATQVAQPPLFQADDYGQDAIVARWEDSEYSFSLSRSAYQPVFALLAFSKRVDALAQAASIEAARLDDLEAPQRESERQKKQDEENRATQEKARLVNKVAFRP